MLDPFDCYELCVQSPRHVVSLLRAVHGSEPIDLREDFCGAAAVARRWCAEAAARGEAGRAVGVDLDEIALAKAAARAREEGIGERIRLVKGDCLEEPRLRPRADEVTGTGSKASQVTGTDIVFVGNFSIGYIHDRAVLVRYLRASHERLSRGQSGFGGGVFVCDTYGGASAFRLGGVERRHPSRGREIIRYSWLHEAADPRTAMVTNSISFRVEIDGEVVQEYPRAFVYQWRLWSLAELREAMLEAGFAGVEVHKDLNIAPGQPATPIDDPAELGEDWIVALVARAH